MDDAVRDRLKRVLVGQLDYPVAPDDLQDGTSLVGKGLALDSVDVVSLVVKLEDEFDVFFEAEEVSLATKSFGALAAAIEKKLIQNGGASERGG